MTKLCRDQNDERLRFFSVLNQISKTEFKTFRLIHYHFQKMVNKKGVKETTQELERKLRMTPKIKPVKKIKKSEQEMQTEINKKNEKKRIRKILGFFYI